MIHVTRIDRLIAIARKAVADDAEVSYVILTHLEDGRWRAQIYLWDYVPFSARGRKDWRITADHSSLAAALDHIGEVIAQHPGKHDITILFDDVAHSGHFFTVTL